MALGLPRTNGDGKIVEREFMFFLWLTGIQEKNMGM
jgi:hypothetical protein